MREFSHAVRIGAAILSGFVAIIFLLIAVSLPSQLRGQARDDRVYYQQFGRAAAYAAAYAEKHNGQLPGDEVLQGLGDTSDARGIWASLSASGGDCDEFRPDPTDRFTLWFWRGEWGECFSYPSGKTTLPMSVSAYLRSGLGLQWAIWWLIGITSGCLCFWLARQRQNE
jgi:hypothetical protein